MKAFPSRPTHDLETNRTVWNDGMDLRDYFAARAMQAMLTTPKEITHKGYRIKDEEGFVKMAYIMADEMIKERERTND